MSLMSEYSSSRERHSISKWSPNVLSTPTVPDSRMRSSGGSTVASGSGTRKERHPGGTRALVVARRGGVRVPTSAGPPPPGRRGPRPPLTGFSGKLGRKDTEERRLTLADMRGSGDMRTLSWTNRGSLLMRLARDTRDPDLRRRCRVIVALEPYRSAHTIFSPEGQRTYLQLRERVLRAVGKSLEHEKDSNLTLPVLDQVSVNRILELQGDAQVDAVIGDKVVNDVFRDMDEKFRALQETGKNAHESGSILKSPSPIRGGHVDPRPSLRRVSFVENTADEGALESKRMTIKDTYNKALREWTKKHRKRLSRKSRENEGKYPPLTPSPTSTPRRSSPSGRTTSPPGSRNSGRKSSEMTIAFLYEGEVKDTSSEEEDRERRRRNWKGQ